MLGWLPEDVSPYGAEIDSLFYFIYYLTAAAFIVVTALMLIFLFVYRDRGDRRAAYTHGSTPLEIIWTVVPAMVFIGIMSSMTLDAGYVILPPLAAALYKADGRSPLAGEGRPALTPNAVSRKPPRPWASHSLLDKPCPRD